MVSQSNNPTSARLSKMAACMARLNYSGLDATTQLIQVAYSTELDHTIPDIMLLDVAEFRTEDEANLLWEQVVLTLIDYGVGPRNARADVDSIFEELALNAAQHSRSELPCRAILECFEANREIVYIIGIADAGIGIPKSLRGNPEYANITTDAVVISRATDQDVTGTTQQRGAGLHHVMGRVRAYHGELTIISGRGFLTVKGGGEPIPSSFDALGIAPHDGTIALVALPIPLS